jgi:Caspase domain
MRMPRGFYCGIRQLCATIGLAALIGLITPHAYAAGGLSISNPDGAAVRALVIGIDDYQHVRKLKGAVADATDIVTSLKNMGVGDVVVLTNAQADRASVLREISALVERTKNNDLIFLSIAGHGTQEPERVKGSEPDGMENVFLLPGFETTPTGSVERVLGSEFNHFIRQFELRGARVIFVADTCHGGGMVRDIDPRAAEMSFRQVPRYTLLVDELKPVSDSNDPKSELDLDHTAFLAAVDRYTKAPEVRIPGIDGLRGALSYAVARAVEGSADVNHDGKVTLKELFSNVRQVVYQLSDQRQNIVTVTSPSRNLDNDVVYLTRGVSIIEPGAPPQASVPLVPGAPYTTASQPQTRVPTPTLPAQQPAPSPSVGMSTTAAPAGNPVGRPIRIASLDRNRAHFTGLAPREAPFEVVLPGENPDLIWDPNSRDVIAGGDVVSYRVDKNDLPSVIDRAAAIRELKQISTKSPQLIKVGPDDSLHRNESMVQVEVSDVKKRSLVLFNITGDGTIQMLYPIGSDAQVLDNPDFRFLVRVREPFGADQIIAVTSEDAMPQLKEALLQLNRRRTPGQMIKMMQRYAPRDARIGSVGLFTAP